MKKATLISALALCIVGTGCTSGLTPQEKAANAAQQAGAQGTQVLLQQQTGHNVLLVQAFSNVSGYAVYQDRVTGEYFSVNVSLYTPGMTYAQLAAAEGTNGIVHNLQMQTYTDTEMNPEYNVLLAESDPAYSEPEYVDTTYTNYIGSGYTFEEGTPYLKDLEKMGANMDAAANQQMGQFLSSQYGLTEERSLEVARLVNNWSTLSKSRGMTATDLKEFSTQVLGADLGSFQKAYEKSTNSGNNKDLDALILKAATTNDISPEQARKVLKSFLN